MRGQKGAFFVTLSKWFRHLKISSTVQSVYSFGLPNFYRYSYDWFIKYGRCKTCFIIDIYQTLLFFIIGAINYSFYHFRKISAVPISVKSRVENITLIKHLLWNCMLIILKSCDFWYKKYWLKSLSERFILKNIISSRLIK